MLTVSSITTFVKLYMFFVSLQEPSSPPEKEDEGVQEEEGEGSQEGGASQEEGEASQEEREASQEEEGGASQEEGEASQEEEGGASQEEGVADTKVMKLYRSLYPTWLIFMCTVFMVST